MIKAKLFLLNIFFLSAQKEKLGIIEKLNSQIEEYREQLANQDKEMKSLISDLENQKQLSSKSPSATIKSMVDKLKKQLSEKEEQQRVLNQALVDLKSDMVSLAKANLTSLSEDQTNDKKLQSIIEKSSAEYQDKLYSLSEELNKHKKELKEKVKMNEELLLELDHVKSQLSNSFFKVRNKYLEFICFLILKSKKTINLRSWLMKTKNF